MSEPTESQPTKFSVPAKNDKRETEASIALRITCPGGRKVAVQVPPDTTTVNDLKMILQQDEDDYSFPATSYLRLVCRGKKLDDESASLTSLGIVQDRTALMALHNAQYAADHAGITAIENILREAQNLTTMDDKSVVHERVTQLCCQLDAIDPQGSVPLRQFRKAALARVQAMEEKCANKTTMIEQQEETVKE